MLLLLLLDLVVGLFEPFLLLLVVDVRLLIDKEGDEDRFVSALSQSAMSLGSSLSMAAWWMPVC